METDWIDLGPAKPVNPEVSYQNSMQGIRLRKVGRRSTDEVIVVTFRRGQTLESAIAEHQYILLEPNPDRFDADFQVLLDRWGLV